MPEEMNKESTTLEPNQRTSGECEPELAASPPLDGTGTAAPQDESGDGALRSEGHQRMTGAVLAGILVSLLSLVVAVFSAYSSYWSSKAADESAFEFRRKHYS